MVKYQYLYLGKNLKEIIYNVDLNILLVKIIGEK